MRKLAPIPREERPPIPDFAPVPRKYRHDGWTPERQKAFIEALADTGSVSRAAAQVNMAQANCYTLRRSPGAAEFRRAWEAALDFGVKRLKDVAFERAMEGQLVPVFVAGKLIGFRRKYNDRLLMFCLRHYGQDEQGRRTTINYFSSRASAGAGASVGAGVLRDASSTSSAAPQDERDGSGGTAEASATTVRTVIAGGGAGSGAARLDEAAAALEGFEGVALDPEAEAAIRAALEACAERARSLEEAYAQGGRAAEDAGEDDPGESFFRSSQPYRGTLVSGVEFSDAVGFVPGEDHWRRAGADMPEELARIRDELERKRLGGLGAASGLAGEEQGEAGARRDVEAEAEAGPPGRDPGIGDEA
jgi:hypothetical protein